MAKIPFDIKYKPQIESGEYKVETRDGRKARIIHWDLNCTSPIVAVMDVQKDLPGEIVDVFSVSGRAFDDLESPSDLFIVTPEEELSEWQRFISACLQKHGLLDCGAADRIAKESAAELLSLAREQIIKDGYVIEKKAFHDAVEKIDDTHKAEMSVEYSLHCKVKNGTRHAVMNWEAFQKVAQKFINIGRAEALKEIEQDPESSYAFKRGVEYGKEEALKDLPRWKTIKKDDNAIARIPHVGTNMLGERMLYIGENAISISRLMKLPGFKEDSHE